MWLIMDSSLRHCGASESDWVILGFLVVVRGDESIVGEHIVLL